MATAEHKHPNYMAIFWYLAILTVVEIAVIYMPLAKFTIGVLAWHLGWRPRTLAARARAAVRRISSGDSSPSTHTETT